MQLSDTHSLNIFGTFSSLSFGDAEGALRYSNNYNPNKSPFHGLLLGVSEKSLNYGCQFGLEAENRYHIANIDR